MIKYLSIRYYKYDFFVIVYVTKNISILFLTTVGSS